MCTFHFSIWIVSSGKLIVAVFPSSPSRIVIRSFWVRICAAEGGSMLDHFAFALLVIQVSEYWFFFFFFFDLDDFSHLLGATPA
jgi:hypothetical protein